MNSEEKLALATKHYLSIKYQEEALARLELALLYNQPAPPTPVGYSDAHWRAVVSVYKRRYMQKDGGLNP